MARPQSRFVCQSCGEAFLRWEGQCRACGGWNTPRRDRRPRAVARRAGRPPRRRGRRCRAARRSRRPSPTPTCRGCRSGIDELDRVLGGGLVPGSLVLVGGEPGIGKSTLLLQAAAGLTRGGLGGPLRHGRGIARTGPPARRPGSGCSRAVRRRRPGPRRARRRADRRGRPRRAAGARRRRLDPDRHGRRARRRGRQRRPGPRVDPPADGSREGRRDRGDPRRPRDEGRLDRRAEDPRAPRRRRPQPRGRALRGPAAPPGDQEPVRLDR